MASKKPGRLTHWGCWNYPGTAIRTACRATLTKTRYRRLWPEKKGTAQEYIDAYDADPMTHCETCRKKAVGQDRHSDEHYAETIGSRHWPLCPTPRPGQEKDRGVVFCLTPGYQPDIRVSCQKRRPSFRPSVSVS